MRFCNKSSTLRFGILMEEETTEEQRLMNGRGGGSIS
jgi:hypothetical protein